MKSSESRARVLIVDDKPDNLRLLSAMLTDEQYEVRRAINGSTALMGVKAAPPDLILLDINMPDMSGYEVCQRLKQDESTQDIPVIFLSALGEAIDKIQAFQVGGIDYITKPFEVIEVLARIENHLALRAAKAEVEAFNKHLEDRVLKRTAELEAEILERRRTQEQLKAANHGLETEIIKRQKMQEQLLYMATHDYLTDLPNRGWLMQRLEQALGSAKNTPSYKFAVVLLDCDRFKVINDSLGHIVGDQLLVAISRRLESYLPPGSVLARLGGDEFTIFLEHVADVNDAIAMVEKLQAELTIAFHLEQYEVFINASFGIVLGNSHYEKPEHLLRDADTAMYRAKDLGKARYSLFDDQMHHQALEVLQMENDLQRALERQEFAIHYQPIVNLNTEKIVGFEALLRWHHPERGWISPAEFIASAEETGLIVPIGSWVLNQACYQLQQWKNDHDLKISVNFSAKQFAQPDLIQQVDAVLAKTQIQPQHLNFEITESALMDNAEMAAITLQKIKARNINIVIDDFGTGYSSLSYLHRFPVSTVKIDRSFVQRMGEDPKDKGLVESIVNLTHNLNMSVVAEGIETSEQAEQLRVWNCEFGQGYFFSKPLNIETVNEILR